MTCTQPKIASPILAASNRNYQIYFVWATLPRLLLPSTGASNRLARLVLCALIVLGTAVLREGIFDRVPLPASGCCVPGSYRTIIFDENLCDNSNRPECNIGDKRHSASNLTFVNRVAALTNETLGDLPLFSTPNEWRGQQIMNRGLIVHGRDRLSESKSEFDSLDESREFSAIRFQKYPRQSGYYSGIGTRRHTKEGTFLLTLWKLNDCQFDLLNQRGIIRIGPRTIHPF